jgi:hypothetical protein
MSHITAKFCYIFTAAACNEQLEVDREKMGTGQSAFVVSFLIALRDCAATSRVRSTAWTFQVSTVRAGADTCGRHSALAFCVRYVGVGCTPALQLCGSFLVLMLVTPGASAESPILCDDGRASCPVPHAAQDQLNDGRRTH